MKTTFKDEGDHVTMGFEGRLDTAASAQTEKDMQVLSQHSGRDVTLDCSALEYISSSGLRLFLGVAKNARKTGNKVTICGLSDALRHVFDDIGFTQLFTII